MSVQTEFSDLIRAMARRDWGTADRLLDEVESIDWRGGSQVIAAAFAIAVNERFTADHSPTDVARFVAETRSRFPAAQSLPTLEMEALVRAALGEVDLIENLDPETALQMQIVFLGKLLQDGYRAEPELEAFIADVERTAADVLWPPKGAI
ncbi:hypothetical protein GCM10011608_22620 [Micromonospora sonchi]|uniref:Uncharacterized protein n=1 Tax=Micromonospora sonchi TaxID=1763543 RepID=A0A917TU36_9ACTN|nr:hypothetical protein [Micromonospora sonchi]GGM37490.1 hypothetical protein GCM10011608_22620 [Micromonospora sonchi]